jgi:uncharacterized protein (DUF488 family)
MKVFTIGFTKTTAESFFQRLEEAGVRRVIDVRLNNVSQLAGFAKKKDISYFLKAICGIDYSHRPELAPTKEMLDALKKHGGGWDDYEEPFMDLMAHRQIEDTVRREAVEEACLLCSEDEPQHCHRRLVAEYLDKKWHGLDIIHL